MIEKALYICSARSMIAKEMFVTFNITYYVFHQKNIFLLYLFSKVIIRATLGSSELNL